MASVGVWSAKILAWSSEREALVKIPSFCAMALAVAVLGVADAARAEPAKKLFFEGDLVRHTLENQKGPFCVLTSQFKRKEAVAWRIRVLDSAGDVADDKVLKSVVVELGDGQKLPARYGPHPPPWGAADRLFLVCALGDPGGLPDRVVGLQGHCHEDGRHDADLAALHAGAVAAHGDRRRTGNEELTAGAVHEDLRRPARALGGGAFVAVARAAEPFSRSPPCRGTRPRSRDW